MLGVAEVFVDETPGGIVRWSIDLFGASQKTLLVIGIVVASRSLLGAVFGVLTGARSRPAPRASSRSASSAAWATGSRALNAPSWAWIAAVVSAGAGIAVLWFLTRPAAASPADPTLRAVEPIGVPDRRRFLVASGAIAAVRRVGGAVGRSAAPIAQRRGRSRRGRGRPRCARADGSRRRRDLRHRRRWHLAARDAERGLLPDRHPPPRPRRSIPRGWTLRITGMVDHEVELTFDDLLAMDRITEFVTLELRVQRGRRRPRRQRAVVGRAARRLLDRAGPHPDADADRRPVRRRLDRGLPDRGARRQRRVHGRDRDERRAVAGRHGFPARLVIPGLYGYVSATKWLSEIELTTWDAFDGYWIPRGWSKEGPIKTQSRIDVPRSGADRRRRAQRRSPASRGRRLAGSNGSRCAIDEDGEWHERGCQALSRGSMGAMAVRVGCHARAHTASRCAPPTATARRRPRSARRPAPRGATGYHTITRRGRLSAG